MIEYAKVTLMDYVWFIYFTILATLLIKVVFSFFDSFKSEEKIDKDEYMRELKNRDV